LFNPPSPLINCLLFGWLFPGGKIYTSPGAKGCFFPATPAAEMREAVRVEVTEAN
jgi:hypothetical protein